MIGTAAYNLVDPSIAIYSIQDMLTIDITIQAVQTNICAEFCDRRGWRV